MTMDDRARVYWERQHEARAVPDVDDHVAAMALAHFGPVEGRRLLDLGCGLGEYARFFGERGADVVAVDTSAAAIDRLRSLVAASSVGNVSATIADAFEIDRLGPFDLVFGSMILHHLEPFPEFVKVLRAAVAPSGRAVFYENSARSRLLVWCRDHLAGHFGIPKFGDESEFPLEPREIDALRSEFHVDIRISDLVLARLASTYLLRGRMSVAASRVDHVLYRIAPLRKYSYRQFVLLS